jgi:hypothetical protein
MGEEVKAKGYRLILVYTAKELETGAGENNKLSKRDRKPGVNGSTIGNSKYYQLIVTFLLFCCF